MKTINSYLKNLFFGTSILAVLALAFSCTEDTASEDIGSEELNAVSIKGKKARPIKAQLDFLFDYENTAPANIVPCPGTPPPGTIPELPNGFALFQTIVSGNMAHLGNLQPGSEFDDDKNEPISGSYLIPQTCDAIGTFPFEVRTTYLSVYVAANGDELHALENVRINFATGTFEGEAEVQIHDGNGRFKNATGKWVLKNGTFDSVGASWEIEGEITY
ncbi:hypothetical protein [Robiginitalea aurantiaca]|uniref:Lipoprotein n=1 Tax=Robiginitalea aurantiaca TaxID=3056915 RepID=A0ABT7WIF5_9FLAO|nr:hypothetical protein [Robiginitalea aurantiaca]MDM9632680.1 hypothetical protein [Robiginitalea aurantiaca]